MHVRFVAVPGSYLPRNETAALLQGETESVYMLNSDEPMPRLSRAMTAITNDWARDEWLHLGPPVHVEFEAVESRLVPGRGPAVLRSSEREAHYLLNRDESLDRVCASLTATVNDYIRREWLHLSMLDGLRDLASR